MALPLPIGHYIDALAAGPGYPGEAVDACVRQGDQAAPILLALLRRAARGQAGGQAWGQAKNQALDDAEASQLFLGVHILAKLRHEPSCAPLLRLLRQPAEAVEYLLGDAVTTTLPMIVASVYDGDEEALFDTVADAGADEYVRDALWGAIVTLTLRGRIAREATAAFIARFDDERLAPPSDMGWYGWLAAIADLGLTELAPRVESLWSDGRLPENILTREHFEADLAAGVAGRPDRSRDGLIDDVAADLAWVDWRGAPEPFVNPMRGVGRNDPCPCGSGKKAKKCCLAPA